jgi:hypothetical protein
MADEPLTDEEVRRLVARLNDLLERLESLPGPGGDTALAAIEALTEVYGEALARVVAALGAGGATVAELAGDELIGHLLVLHGLHPDPVVARAVLTPPESGPPHFDGPTLIPVEALLRKPAAL